MHNPRICQYINSNELLPTVPVPNGYALPLHTTTTNTVMKEIKSHTLAFVRWMDTCNSLEELSFCKQVLLLFLIKGDGNSRLPSGIWKDINYYLTLCMHNRMEVLHQHRVTKLLN